MEGDYAYIKLKNICYCSVYYFNSSDFFLTFPGGECLFSCLKYCLCYCFDPEQNGRYCSLLEIVSLCFDDWLHLCPVVFMFNSLTL